MKRLEMIKTGKIHYLLLENRQKMFLSNTSENLDDSEYRSDTYNHWGTWVVWGDEITPWEILLISAFCRKKWISNPYLSDAIKLRILTK